MITKIYFHEPLPQASNRSRRFAGRGFHAVDGWTIETLPNPGMLGVRMTHPKHGEWIVKHVTYDVFTDSPRRVLKDEELVRMNLPKEMWEVELDGVAKDAAPSIQNYCQRIDEFLSKGYGFVLTGEDGVGKTGAAVVLAKEARHANRTVFFITPFDIRELTRNRVQFERDTSILERCKEVDFLVIDGLRPEDAKDSIFDAAGFGALVEARQHAKRSTVITTRMEPTVLSKFFPHMSTLLPTKSPTLPFEGESLRDSKVSESRGELIVRRPPSGR